MSSEKDFTDILREIIPYMGGRSATFTHPQGGDGGDSGISPCAVPVPRYAEL